MKREYKASISIIKIICVSLILLALSGAGVMVMATQVNTVTITLASGYELTVLTNKTNVAEILQENNIVLEENERVTPDLDKEITTSKTIVIRDKSIQEIQVAKISESGIETTLDEILKSYSPIIEKIVTEQEAIPYETITKDASEGAADKKNKVIQSGEDGIKEVIYKVKYQNDVEIEKIKLSITFDDFFKNVGELRYGYFTIKNRFCQSEISSKYLSKIFCICYNKIF